MSSLPQEQRFICPLSLVGCVVVMPSLYDYSVVRQVSRGQFGENSSINFLVVSTQICSSLQLILDQLLRQGHSGESGTPESLRCALALDCAAAQAASQGLLGTTEHMQLALIRRPLLLLDFFR